MKTIEKRLKGVKKTAKKGGIPMDALNQVKPFEDLLKMDQAKVNSTKEIEIPVKSPKPLAKVKGKSIFIRFVIY